MQKVIYCNTYSVFDYMAHKEQRTLIAMGQSIGITLPQPWLKYYNAKMGDKVEITTYGTTAEIKLLNNKKGEDKGENDKKTE